MPLEIGIWRIDSGLQELNLGGLDLESRLEDVLHEDISIVSPNWMVVGRQVKTPYDKFIDLLCIDRDANLIVVELKRDMTDREVVAQLLDYGSWVRALRGEDIVHIFDEYRKKYHKNESSISIDEAFCSRFSVKEMPEELNATHDLVIVGTGFDSSTERIVEYLASEYEVRINAIFFRVFKDGERQYLTRIWLRDPTMPDVLETKRTREVGEWNGEFYVSFGHDPESRHWDDAVKYGFVSGGRARWYSQTLHMLEPGSRIWVNVPGVGYTGVGVVEEPVVKVDRFTVEEANGKRVSITEMPLAAPGIADNKEDVERAEYLVRVRWLKTFSLEQAIKEKGFFGNQNTVARPTKPKWNFTVERLKERFGIKE